MVNIYLRTRGFRLDYSFLLETPKTSDSIYKTDLEKPTCILEYRSTNLVYLFLSGIPSQRKDHQKTPIRYDLVAEISSEPWDNYDNQPSYPLGLTGLIWMWLNEVREALQEIEEDGDTIELVRLPVAVNSDLGQLLDQILPKDYLEEILQATYDRNWTETDKIELNEKLKEVVLTFKPPIQDISNYREKQPWWGGINNDDSCYEWIKLAYNILSNQNQGKVLLLNIATPKSLANLSGKNGQVGVLLAKQWSQYPPQPLKTRPSPKTPETPQWIQNIIKDPSIPEVMKESLIKQWKTGSNKHSQAIQGIKKNFSSLW